MILLTLVEHIFSLDKTFDFCYNFSMELRHKSIDRFALRLHAVENYLSKGSLYTIASTFKIHPSTLKRWIKRYRDGGEENLKRSKTHQRHPRRFSPLIEEKIVFLKERNPGLTISKAQKLLKKNGIVISLAGIWRIWHRYNLINFHINENLSEKVTCESPEITAGINEVEKYLDKGNISHAARIVNTLPSCTNIEILKKISDRFLSLQRKTEKLDLTFYEIPFPETALKAKTIRKEAEMKNLLYTSLRAGIIELYALDWGGNHKAQLSLAGELRRQIERIKGRGSSARYLRLEIQMHEVRSLIFLGKVEEALSCIRKIDEICRHSSHSSLLTSLATIHSAIGSNKKARCWIEKSLKCNKSDDVAYTFLGAILIRAGDYNSAKKILRRLKKKHISTEATCALLKAICALEEGKVDEASRFANQSLSMAEKKAISAYLWSSSFVLACCSCALDEREKAHTLIESVVTRLKKGKVKRAYYLARILLGENSLPQDACLKPNVRVAILIRQASRSLKITDYRRAFNYASTQQLMGLFHRLALFYPEPVNKLIARGKPTGLPKALLRLPVFQKNITVYHLMFLGPVRVYRNGIRLRDDPTPMYASFNIHLGFKKRIELNSLYRNFWPHAKNPRGLLSHLLFDVRKYLRLLPGTLFIKQGFLHFKGYITTDYQFYEETMIRAKALLRAGEWGFAKREYMRAFVLFRGAPFKKMYDPWSEHMRRVILNELETEAIHFARSCIERNNKRDAKKVLKKVSKIIPQSEEIKRMLNDI